jgi:hypothetical protein
MIKKVLIILKKYVNVNTAKELGVMPFVKEDFAVKPKAWKEESGPSHYGWLVEWKQKDLKAFEKAINESPSPYRYTLLDADQGVEKALASVGMEILEDAEEPAV